MNKNNMLSFYPNLGVTSPLFDILTDDLQWKGPLMTYGRPGISKTMAYLFACHLTSIIANYRCQCEDDAKILADENVMSSSRPKIFYMNFKNITTVLNVAQLMHAQCEEIIKKDI